MTNHPSTDHQLLDKLTEVIESSLQNHQFGASDLAEEMGLSNSKLNRKLQSLTGQSTSQFIREYRLKKASELLSSKDLTAAEVAYLVGFSTHAYFNTSFKEYYGYPPGEAKLRNAASQKGKGFFSKKMIILAMVFCLLLLLTYTVSHYVDELPAASESKIEKSIAVLPFQYLSSNEEKRHWAIGVATAIRNHLFKIEGLHVLPQMSIANRDLIKTPNEIGKDLRVDYLIDGAVQLEEDRLQITVQLVDVQNKIILFDESYDKEEADILSFQSEIAQQIASSMHVVITPEQKDRIEKKSTSEVAAYELFLEAQMQYDNWWNIRDKDNLDQIHDLLDRALRIDPEYENVLVLKGYAFQAGLEFDSAMHYADLTINLNPKHNKAYQLKARVFHKTAHYDSAIKYNSIAMELPYTSGEPHWWYVQMAMAYNSKGEIAKSLYNYEKSIDLAPDDFLYLLYARIGLLYIGIGHFDKAQEYYKKSIQRKAYCPHVGQYAWNLEVQGKFLEAYQYIDSISPTIDCEATCNMVQFHHALLMNEMDLAKHYFFQVENTYKISQIVGYIHRNRIYFYHVRAGNKIEAERVYQIQVDALQAMVEKGHNIHNMLLSELHAFRGEKTLAMHYLRAYAEGGFRHGHHDYLMVDPFFENLQDDPEFLEILSEAQMEKAAIRAQIGEMEENGELNL